MPTPEDERFAALAEEIARLVRRIDQIELRLSKLEPHRAAEPPPLPQPRVEPHPLPPPLPPPVVAPQPAPVVREGFETRMGLTWINRIGVITLIIGVAFFFKYAIDNQWIGETGRVVLGVLAGIVALGAAELVSKRDQKVFAQGVCGLGISILYLSFYATFGFYHLLPVAAAFLLMAMVTASAGFLALRYDALAIGALGLIGGYATPLLLSTGQDAPWTFFGYVLLIGCGAIAMARPRGWRALEAMALVGTTVLYLTWFARWFAPEKQVVATAAAFAFYAVFSAASAPWIFYTAQVLTALGMVSIWTQPVRFLVWSEVAGAAGLLIAQWKNRTSAAVVSFVSFWAAYGLWTANREPQPAVPVFTLLTMAFALYSAWAVMSFPARRDEARFEHWAVLGLNGPAYFASGYFLLKPEYDPRLGLFAAACGAAHLLIAEVLWAKRGEESKDAVLLACGMAAGFLTLAIPIQFAGYTITMSWAVEAAVLAWIGQTQAARFRQLAFAGAAAVFGFAVIRLFAFDLWIPGDHRLLANSRFLAFAMTAACLWLAAWWSQAQRWFAGAWYITGHFLILAACLAEFQDWVRSAVSEESEASAAAIGVSIFLGLYAVMLIAIGVGRRSRLNRVMGLGLVGVVVAKLYLYDVWEASRLFRTAAFLGLGALMLGVSFLYSRFRGMVEGWLGRD